LYVPDQHDERAHDEPRALRHDAVRRRQGFLADRAARLRDQHHGGAPVDAGHDGSGAHRLCEAEPGQDQLCLRRPGLDQPSARREKRAEGRMGTVPYRGGAPAVADTVAGQTQLFFTAGTQSLPHVKAGTLRLLAVTEGKRSPFLPDVPTVAETLPGYEMAVWYGAFGPAGMPKDGVARV